MVRVRVRVAVGAVCALLAGTGGAVVLAPGVARGQFVAGSVVTRSALPAGEVLVDGVVAAVDIDGDDRPPVFALVGEVELALRYELAARGAPAALTTRVDVSVSAAIVEQIVGEKLLERDARRTGQLAPLASAVALERARLAARLGTVGGVAAVLRAARATAADFDAFVRRRMVVAEYLERQLPRSIEPTEAEMRAAYGEERFGAFRANGVPYADARPEIRLELLRAGYPRAIRSYLRSISSRARVRMYAQ